MLLHIITEPEWATAQARGQHIPESLATEGFIHMSTPEQVHLPANRLFRGRTDVMLAIVDPTMLTDPIRFEPGVPSDPDSMRFPHLYGPLPTSAIARVVPWAPDRDGLFSRAEPLTLVSETELWSGDQSVKLDT